jgi:hypothetical protein
MLKKKTIKYQITFTSTSPIKSKFKLKIPIYNALLYFLWYTVSKIEVMLRTIIYKQFNIYMVPHNKKILQVY